jgi:uncharacterized protein YgbK (DUF1537 family)
LLVILADDLTGTLDAAAPFAGRRLRTEIALAPSAIPDAIAGNPDVLSINVETREIGAHAAQAAMRVVLEALPADVLLFKKIDSRLKGHIAAELDVLTFTKALVAPAIPDFGRLVTSGHVCGFGVDVPIAVRDRLGRHAADALIPDTASPEDLSLQLDRALEDGCDLLVGARGLADALARRMTGNAPLRPVEVPAGAALFVIGSRDPITLAQIALLRQEHGPAYHPAPNGQLSQEGGDDATITLVQAVSGDVEMASPDVARHLAESIFPGLVQPAMTLILSGGATAEAVLERMDIRRFQLLGECMPGLGIAFANGHCIIAKSGGFGPPDTLSAIARQVLGHGG